MSLQDLAILGLVQGLTEFLPVSSSGHLVIVGSILDLEMPGLTLEIWVHLATLAAVVIALRHTLWMLVQGVRPGSSPLAAAEGRRWIAAVVAGSVPALVVGLLFKERMELAFGSLRLVGIDLLVTAAILFISRFFPGGQAPIGKRRGFWIGVAQALAILPGISRSGTTLTAGLMLGLSTSDAARFSFLLSIPAILGAVLLDLPALAELGQGGALPLVVSFLTAAASGYLAIRLVWKVMKLGRLATFAPYCVVVGVAVLVLASRTSP